MIKEGQIWVRQPDENYLPDDIWKVKVVKSDRNGVTYTVVEYNGESTDGVQVTTPLSDFKKNYYPVRGQRA